MAATVQSPVHPSVPSSGPTQAPRRLNGPRLLVYFLLVVVIIGFMVPFVWMLSTALKPIAEIFTFPPRVIPENPTLDNFAVALNPTFVRYGLNSLLVATMATVV